MSYRFDSDYCYDNYVKLIEKDGKIFKPKNNEELYCAVRQYFGSTKVDMKEAQKHYGTLNTWDVSDITDMSGLFKSLPDFNEPLNKWDVSKVQNMNGMFNQAKEFNQPLNNWKVGNVKSMSYMFAGASSFNQPLNDWDVSKVYNMSYMFAGASSFNQPLNKWNVSNVRKMEGMFDGANKFNQPLNKWDVSKVDDMDYMFRNAIAFNQPLCGKSWREKIGELSTINGRTGMFDGRTNCLIRPEDCTTPYVRRNYMKGRDLDCEKYLEYEETMLKTAAEEKYE